MFFTNWRRQANAVVSFIVFYKMICPFTTVKFENGFFAFIQRTRLLEQIRIDNENLCTTKLKFKRAFYSRRLYEHNSNVFGTE